MSLWKSEDILDYQLNVFNLSLKETVPLTLWGKRLDARRIDYSRNEKIDMTPNKEITATLLISRAFDMSLCGDYIITVSKNIPVSGKTLYLSVKTSVTISE